MARLQTISDIGLGHGHSLGQSLLVLVEQGAALFEYLRPKLEAHCLDYRPSHGQPRSKLERSRARSTGPLKFLPIPARRAGSDSLKGPGTAK